MCCNSEKKWIPEAPSCKRKLLTHNQSLLSIIMICLHCHNKFYHSIAVDCGPLDNPANGRVQVSFTTYRSRAYYYCNKGYDRIGSFRRTCGSNGQWVEEETICQRK